MTTAALPTTAIPTTAIPTTERGARASFAPQGLDRLIERLGLALVAWSRQHAGRRRITHERQIILLRHQRELERRDRALARLAPPLR